MDFGQTFINMVIGLAGALGGWVLKNVHEAVKDLQIADKELTSKVNSIDVLVAGQYVRRSEMEQFREALFHKLDRIESKIDLKADKE